MVLDKSALLELTEALRSAADGQLKRRLLHTIPQALIDAEAVAHIGACRTSDNNSVVSKVLLSTTSTCWSTRPALGW